MKPIREDFRGTLTSALKPLEIGTGHIEHAEDSIRLVVENAAAGTYSDAQLFDYAAMKRRDFPCRPPLRMIVRAWASHSADQLKGTAGFGFWNQPVMPGQALPRLPRMRSVCRAMAGKLLPWIQPGWRFCCLRHSRRSASS